METLSVYAVSFSLNAYTEHWYLAARDLPDALARLRLACSGVEPRIHSIREEIRNELPMFIRIIEPERQIPAVDHGADVPPEVMETIAPPPGYKGLSKLGIAMAREHYGIEIADDD